MTIIRRILLVLSLVVIGGGLWALTHNNHIGSVTIARPLLIVACVVAGIIGGLALVTEGIMLMSNVQHPEPEDPPIPQSPVLHKPEPTPEPKSESEPKSELQKSLDAIEQAEEYLAQTKHRISVVIEEDDPEDDPDTPKTPPTVA
jgi:hypothetical protein